MFGISKIALYGITAVILGTGVVWGIGQIREDARNDLLRELELAQINRTHEDVAEREKRIKEIENATADELMRRACRSGLLAPDACP